MGAVQDAINLAFRDFVTEGVPASGAHEPRKVDIRAVGAVIEQLITSGGVSAIYDTALDGLDATTDGDLFLVKGTPPDTFALLFKNVLGAAVYQNLSMPSTEIVQEVAQALVELAGIGGAATIGTGDGQTVQRSIDGERLTRTPVLPPTDPSPMAPSYLLTAGKSAPRYDDLIDLIVVMGQSNAGGATVGPAVATTPLYRGRCLSPDIGSRITAGWRFSSFADAVETYNSGSGEGETILTSMLSHLVQANDSVTGAARRKFAGFVSAVGGEDLAELKRGSFAWENAIQGVEDACNIARDALTELRVPAIVWIQGENQTGDGTTTEQYYNMLRILARDAAEDVMRITGQRIAPMLYIVQTSTVDNALVLNQQVQMAQHRAAGEGWARLVGPLYPYPPAASSGVETIHKNGAGQNLMGQAVARAIFAESQGLGWQALRVRSARLTAANKILIDCDVPVAPLVIDTAGAVDPTGLQGLYGFDVQLPNGTFATISSAAIVNSTSVELTMAASITAAWVRLGYAMRRNAATTEDGPAKGARGCIRDSATDTNLFGQGTLRNWLCHWTAVIPAAGSF